MSQSGTCKKRPANIPHTSIDTHEIAGTHVWQKMGGVIVIGGLISGRKCVILLQLLATYNRDLSTHTRDLHVCTYEYTRVAYTDTDTDTQTHRHADTQTHRHIDTQTQKSPTCVHI